ncbi:hypothetical protein [Streptomyces sp. NPDC091215]|uniref:hypothetical protein n=1 Tax=Streptomyces sp. NPDC091215 TaxID=3155192 RepID=UPI0034239453
MDDDRGRHHPSRWELGKNKDGQKNERSPEWRAWVAWFESCLERGEWTSLGQAATISVEGRYNSTQIEPRLGIDQSTLSRWLNSENLPQAKKVRMAIAALNQYASRPVTETELREGLRLLAEARRAVDPPAHRALVEAQREAAETLDRWSEWRAVYARLGGQMAEAQTTVQRLEDLQRGFEAADADAKRLTGELTEARGHVDGLTEQLSQARRRVADLEEQLANVESVLENWQDRYDRVHAQFEIALEAASEERLQMQDDLSTLRARAMFAEQERKKARKEARKLREQLSAAQLGLAMGPLANASASPRADAQGDAERIASPTPPAATSAGTHHVSAHSPADALAGQAEGTTSSPNPDGAQTPSAPPPLVNGYRYPVPPPPVSSNYDSKKPYPSLYWASRNMVALVLVVMCAAATAIGSGFGQLERADHNTVWQLAVYSIIGALALFMLGAFMLVLLDEFSLMKGVFTRIPQRQVDEGVVIFLQFLTALATFLLAVFLPHWVPGLDTFGGWLQYPLNPD